MRADRLLATLLLIQTRGKMTAGELSRELEVSERTVYRDLDALSAAGVPVYAERGPGGGVALLEGYETRLTGLKEAEMRALSQVLSSLSVPGSLVDLGLGGALESALLKLSAALPSMHRHSAKGMRGRVHLDTARWFAPKELVPHLQTVQEAVWGERRLNLVYCADDGGVRRRVLEPYGLVAKVGVWYVVGKTARGTRVYRVSRIKEAALGEAFERPQDFDLADFWNAWCRDFETSRPTYPVLLRVSKEGVDALSRVLGEWVRETLSSQEDAAGWRTLDLTFENAEQAVGLLLGLTPLVEVQEPEELRERLVAAAGEVLRMYATRLTLPPETASPRMVGAD